MTHHIFYQGDCKDLLPSIPDESIDLIITDPPYGMEFVSHWRKYENDITVPIDNDKKFDFDLMTNVASELYRVLKPNSHLYLFCNDISLGNFRAVYGKFFNLKRTLVWVKNNWSSGDLEADYGHKKAESH